MYSSDSNSQYCILHVITYVYTFFSTLQDSLSVNSELSKSNDSLTDSSTKVMLKNMSVNDLCRSFGKVTRPICLFQEKGGAFKGMFKKTTKPAKEDQSQVCRRKSF